MNQHTILIVDDEPRTRIGLSRILEAWKGDRYVICAAADGREALGILERERVRLLITDIKMPEISGLQLAGALNSMPEEERPAILLISGYAEFEFAQRAIQLGVVDYLLKPIGRDKLIAAVERALACAEERARIGMMEKVVDRELLQTGDTGRPLSDPVREALEYIDGNLDQPFTMRDAASRVHLNPSYFSVLFKDEMGMTFSEYVTRRRLQRAKEMLLRTKLPVSEIAERVGYQSAKHFAKMFRQYEGSSPGDYRNQSS